VGRSIGWTRDSINPQWILEKWKWLFVDQLDGLSGQDYRAGFLDTNIVSRTTYRGIYQRLSRNRMVEDEWDESAGV
jgi:hypothetical protein